MKSIGERVCFAMEEELLSDTDILKIDYIISQATIRRLEQQLRGYQTALAQARVERDAALRGDTVPRNEATVR